MARLLCHELRNVLHGVDLNRGNLTALLQRVGRLADAFRGAVEGAAAQLQIPGGATRLACALEDRLDVQSVRPVSLAASAREAQRTAALPGFIPYLQTTVQWLDLILHDQELPLEWKRLQPAEVWQEACDLIARSFQKAGIAWQTKVPVPPVWADHWRLVHVFLNLAKNAVEAGEGTGEKRPVLLSGREEDDMVVLAIDSFGRPITDEELAQLFRYGFTTKAGRNRGRGLSLVRRYVRAMNGQVRAERLDGGGLRFVVRLPRPPADYPNRTDATAATVPP